MRYGRLPWFEPADLDDHQRAYYERLLAGPRDRASLTDADGRLYGAFNARLLDPPVGTAIQELGAALRFGGELSARDREIVILEVAASERCEYEWAAHAKVARRAGLTEDELEGLRSGADVPSLSPHEQSVRRTARALIIGRDLSDEQFTAAEEQIGLVSLFDIISLVGHYQHTAMALRVWRTPPRDETQAAFGPAGPAGQAEIAGPKQPASPEAQVGPVPLPGAFAALLAGRPALDAIEQGFPFLTVDPGGFPHVALLSRAEVEVSPAGDAVFAVIASERTRANLIRNRRCSLIAVADQTAHYAKFRVTATVDQPPLLGCQLQLVEYKADSLGIPLSPIEFSATGDIAQLEHWGRSLALLRQLAGTVPRG
ncbi:MAG TPA: carboxymuconolactone decarboxylase family protein [Trebonia sp.]|jgi:AhpD family alkylhydroperoxidase